MEFYNQSWFWVGFFTVLASIGSILVKEWITSRYQLKSERIKLYETDQFKAYNKLYEFVSSGYCLWPPSEPRREYIALIKVDYFKQIKPNMLYYQPEIRELLRKVEAQYHCLSDPDCHCDKSLDQFLREDFLDILNKIQNIIERKTDEIVHKI